MENGNVVVENEVVGSAGETPNTAVESPVLEKPKRIRVSGEDFMVAWEETAAGLAKGTLTGSGVLLVATRLGLQPNTVEQRASKYRANYGVALSKMPRGSGAKFNAVTANERLAAIKAKLNEVVPPSTETEQAPA